MRKHLLGLIILLTLVSFKGYGQCWVQTWADEFDGTNLDATKWNYDLGAGGWGNNELQYYTSGSNNITVSGGQLAITAKYEPNYNGTGSNYTSSRLLTKGKFSQTYGRYEARIKVPAAGGVWPAFWTLGDNITTIQWPKCGEIDIMETQNTSTKLWNTVHYPNRRGTHAYRGITLDYLAGLSNDFHIYAIEWDAQEIRWYFDGALTYKVLKSEIATNNEWPFDLNQHILLNVAVGGNFAGSGNVVSSHYNNPNSPVSMVVDYVRAYKLGACTPTSYVSITSPTNNSFFSEGSDITITADASIQGGTVSKVEFFDGSNKIGESTTSPYSMIWIDAAVGPHSLTAVATDAVGGQLTSSSVSVTVNNIPVQAPYSGSPINIPGRIEAEYYDLGGSGLAYFDATTGNSGTKYRSDNVDIQNSTDADGAFEITNTAADEWLEYTVDVTTAGTYNVDVRLNGAKNSKLRIELDGQSIGTYTVNFTGKQEYRTYTLTNIPLTAGQKVMRIYFVSTGISSLNYINFTRIQAKMGSSVSVDGATSINALKVYPNPTSNHSFVKLNVADVTNAEFSIVNSMGVVVSKGKLSSNLEGTINLAGMENGIYFVKVTANEVVYVEKLVKE